VRSGRIGRLREELSDDGRDGFLVSAPDNVRYLTGFSGSSGFLLVLPDRAVLLTDSRYEEQAEDEVVAGVEVEIARDGLGTGITELVEAVGPSSLAFEADHVTVEQLRRLREGDARVSWEPTRELVEDMRAVKDADEIALLARAAGVACRALESTLPAVREGASELELVAELEYQLRRAGSGPPAFESIVAAGPRSALPHARPSERPVREGDLLLLDFGATVEGYRSDVTRTVVLGPPAPWHRDVHGAVLRAQEVGRRELRPGRPAREVDASVRDVLDDAGYAENFGHSTGHGLGLAVHESPSLSRRSEDILQRGHVVTIEPGVYLRGRGGVRIEDDVVVEEDGARVLTDAARDLREL
jgi:Xaa-Pro aminopeptidase